VLGRFGAARSSATSSVAEGVTSARVAAILNAHPVLDGTVTAPPEGAVLPETYDIHRGESRALC
jgi:UPF0755 protein